MCCLYRRWSDFANYEPKMDPIWTENRPKHLYIPQFMFSLTKFENEESKSSQNFSKKEWKRDRLNFPTYILFPLPSAKMCRFSKKMEQQTIVAIAHFVSDLSKKWLGENATKCAKFCLVCSCCLAAFAQLS